MFYVKEDSESFYKQGRLGTVLEEPMLNVIDSLYKLTFIFSETRFLNLISYVKCFRAQKIIVLF